MRTRLVVAGTLAAVCVLTAGAQQPVGPPLSQQFQEAVTAMEARGDCRAASPLFARVADGSDRALAARALVYLGVCHERLGRADAATAYRRVIDQFPDQRAAVAEARRRLAALTPVGTARATRTPTLRRTWTQMPSFLRGGGGVSFDGRVMALVDADGGVSLTDLASGTNRRQMAVAGAGSVGMKPVPSPDGTAAVFPWTPDDGSAEQLRIVRGLDDTPRVLLRASPGESLIVQDWRLPDRLLLEVTARDGGVRLHVLRIADGALDPVVALRHHPASAKMSPDGRWIAYDDLAPDGRTRDIVITAAEDGTVRSRLEAPSDDYAPAWSPRGDRLLFVSDRSGTASLWAYVTRDGRPVTPTPTLLQRDLGMVSDLVGVTASGAYHYNRQVGLVDVYVQSLDDSGRPSGSARATTATAMGGNLMPSFAADGRSLVHVSGMMTVPGSVDEYDITTGTTRTRRTGLDDIRQPRWSLDGRYLVAKGIASGNLFGIHRIDLEAGRATPLVTVPPSEETDLGAFTWLAAPAGTLAYVRNGSSVRRFAVPDGSDQTWFDLDGVSRIVTLAASPSDDRVAIIAIRKQVTAVLLLREADGTARDLVVGSAAERTQLLSLAWMPDGRWLLYTQRTAVDRTASLWRIPVSGGSPESLGLQVEGMRDLAVSPDGRHLAWSAGYPRREPWVLEHVVTPK